MNTPADLQIFHECCAALQRLSGKNHRKYEDGENLELLERTKQSFNKVASIVEQFDYEKVPFNGYRTSLFMCALLFERLLELSTKELDLVKIKAIATYCDWYLRSCLQCSKQSANGVMKPMSVEFFLGTFIQEYASLKEELKIVLNHFSGLNYTPDSQILYNLFPIQAIIYTSTSWGSLLRSLYDAEHRSRSLLSAVLTTDYMAYIKTFRSGDIWQIRLRNIFISNVFHRNIELRTVQLEIGSRYVYKVKENADIDLELDEKAATRNIRCRLLKHKDSGDSDLQVLLYVHGGALVSCAPEFCYETVFLEFVQRLGPKVALLAVDYRLAPENKFPAGLQDVLDAYLWLSSSTSEESRSKVLNFGVSKVVLCGDSGGATLCASVLCTLADIRRKWPQERHLIRLPDGFASLCGAFSLQATSFPSTIISSFDAMMPPIALVTAMGTAYSHESQMSEFEKSRPLSERQDIRKHVQLAKHPYFSPLEYQHFEDFENVHLVLITSSICLMADHNVAFAQKWPSKVKFHVFHRLLHAYYLFALYAKSCDLALKESIDEIKVLFD